MALVFRAERAALAEVEPTGLEWLAIVSSEFGFILIVESALVLLATRLRSRSWWPIFAVGHIGAHGAAIIAQQFFLQTGTALDASLLRYALRNSKDLMGVVASGVDFRLCASISGALFLGSLGFLFSYRGGFRRPLASIEIDPARARLRIYCSAGLGAVLTMLPFALAAPGQWPQRSLLASLLGQRHETHRLDSSDTARPPNSTANKAVEPFRYEPPVLVSHRPVHRPNLLVIVVESLRADMVIPYADESRRSIAPFLAELSEQAWVVDRAYTSQSHTTKALVGIVCGNYARLGMDLEETELGGLQIPCLPHLLGELGYRSAFMQSALGTFEGRRALAKNMGFEHITTQEDLDSSRFQPVGYVAMDEFALLEPIRAYVRNDPDTPYFLTVLTSVTHHPYRLPDSMQPSAHAGTPIENYVAAIHYTDNFLRRLFFDLFGPEGPKDTIVVIIGDHGEAFGEHGRQQHDAVPYEEGTRVPMFILGPNWLGEPRRIEGPRQNLDILPTVLDWLGVRWTGRLPGNSLKGQPRAQRVTSCWYDSYCMTLHEDRMSYVFHFGRRPTQVFDLGKDPRELHDLSPSFDPSEISAIEAGLLRYRDAIDASHAHRSERIGVPATASPGAAVRRPDCMTQCVADSDSATPGLQADCQVSELDLDGSRISIPLCTADALSTSSPICYETRSGEQLHPHCREHGWNLEFVFSRLTPPQVGATMDVRCKLSGRPKFDCPTR